jgi:hypothetical protein
MKRFMVALSAVAVLAAVILVFSAVGYAASPAQDCADAGGTYNAAGPDSSCVFAGDPVGQSGNTKGGSQETGPGKSEPNEEETVCTGVNNKPHRCP